MAAPTVLEKTILWCPWFIVLEKTMDQIPESPDEEEEEPPEGPKSKKGRPFGHGTTNATRRAKRAHLQWSALEKADPGSPRTLMKHLQALEEARERAQKEAGRAD